MKNNNKELQEFQQYVISEAKSQNKNPEEYVKELGESGLKEAYKRFQAYKKKQAQKAAHGAKLQYFKALKNQCAEDEELVYYKKGGVVGCGCVKKNEEGGKTTPTKKKTPVDKFKEDQATRDSIEANVYNDQEIQTTRPGSYKKNNKGKVQWTPDRTKAPYNKVKKNCSGSKMKFAKGDKVCPKCGKVHKAGVGCSVAAFKERFKNGGSLNGVPFIRMGSL